MPDPVAPCLALPEGDRTLQVKWGTTLTYFYPKHIVVHDQEDAGFLWFEEDDEVYYFVEADASESRQTLDSAAFSFFGDITEGGHNWPATQLGIHKYIRQIQINLIEAGTLDDETYLMPHHSSIPGGCFTGVCTLPESETAKNGYYPYYDSADEGTRDYFYKVHFCLRHEHAGPTSVHCIH